jgi:hypothetical protein
MEIFLSYASEDKAAAEPIAFSLRDPGHTVFLDRDDLPPGKSFDQRIERAVNDSDIFIFLISPDSVAETRYTLTELNFARHKWRSPNNGVLPVMVRKTPLERVPYLAFGLGPLLLLRGDHWTAELPNVHRRSAMSALRRRSG